MAQSSTITQRIALDGAQEITKQLADLGKVGETAVKQIQDATVATSPHLSTLSTAVGNVRAAFATVAEAAAPLKGRFDEFGQAALAVGANVGKITSALGIGFTAALTGGALGLISLIKNAADSTHQLDVQASTLGLTVEQLQVYRKAASLAGVDSDKLFTGLSRLLVNVGKEGQKFSEDIIKLFQGLPEAATAAGVGIVRGIEPATTGIKSRFVTGIADSKEQVQSLIDLFVRTEAQLGNTFKPELIESFRRRLTLLGGDTTKLGETFRIAAAEFGVNFSSQTVGETLARSLITIKDPLSALGITFKDIQDAGVNTDAIIRKFATGLQNTKDPARQLEIAVALLGKGARELIPAFKGGEEGLRQIEAAARGSNLLFTALDVEIGKNARTAFVQLEGAAGKLRDQLVLAFAPGLTVAAKAFTDLIKDNAGTLKAWAQVIANEVLPSLNNLINQFRGSAGEAQKLTSALPTVLKGGSGAKAIDVTSVEPTTGESQVAAAGTQIDQITTKLEAFKRQIKDFEAVVTPVFRALQFVLGGVAFVLNSLFGTEFNSAGAGALLLVTRLIGGFRLLEAGIGLATGTLGGLLRLLGAPVTASSSLGAILLLPGALPLVGLIAASAAIAIFRDDILDLGRRGREALDSLGEAIQNRITAAFSGVNFEGFRLAVLGALENARLAFDNWATAVGDAITGVLTRAANAVAAFIKSIPSSFFSLFGGGGSTAAAPAPAAASTDAGETGVDFATGGHVFGPGGTDNVPAWLTAGEYVVKLDAVRHYGTDFFHALNQMQLPRFSLGGLVAEMAERFSPALPVLHLAEGGVATGGPTHVLNLTIGSEQFTGLSAPGAVFDKLSRHARSSAIRSAGVKPSWFGA
jgi:hypothetical protein